MRAWFLVLLVGCQPRFVETSAEVDAFIAQADFDGACVALKMTHHNKDELRHYAAEKLAEYPEIPEATACICAAMYDAEKGTWDPPVVEGVEGTRRDDLAECIAPALSDERIEKSADLVTAVGKMYAPAGIAAMAGLVKNGSADPTIRAAAVEVLRMAEDQRPLVVETMASDPSPQVRAAAAAALEGHDKDKDVREALTTAATSDTDPSVRASAVKVLGKSHKKTFIRDLLCRVMMEDEDEVVRRTAIEPLKGTTDEKALACLGERLKKEETSPAVRTAYLEALAASPHEDSATILCKNIGPFLRMYVTDEIADRIDGVNIIESQNNRDWENSYSCVEQALRQAGYSCFAKHHLGGWMIDLGGKGSLPRCPGMSALGGATEMEF